MTKEEAQKAQEAIIRRYHNDPVAYGEDTFGIKYSEQEKPILRALAKHKKVSVRSGHHIGKDTTAAGAVWWFLETRPFPKIICTANTKEQLYDVLWAEMSKWQRKSERLQTVFEWTKEKIFHKGASEEWWAVARTAQKGEALQGRHADHQLVVIDEASGIDESVFEASSGLMSGENVYVLMISNPTRNNGFFRRTHTEKGRKLWHTLHFSSLESPFCGKDWIEFMKESYGERSNVYRVRVLGEFPTSDEDAVIPLDWVEDATERSFEEGYEPLILGLDVGAGGDLSVLIPRRGATVYPPKIYNTPDTIQLAKIVAGEAEEMGADIICVDPIGIGKGTFDFLMGTGVCGGRVYPVDVRKKSYEPGYNRLRDELWWRARKQFEQGTVSLPDDPNLMLELSSVKYKVESQKVKVDDKRAMKKEIGHSPDRADALCLTYYIDDNIAIHEVEDEEEEARKIDRKRNPFTGY
jgi:hypothetical protein